MKARSIKWDECIYRAFNDETLVPPTCMDIVADVYGQRATRMRPATLARLTYGMMAQQTMYKDMYADCMEAVQEWCNTY
jgi:hypothetical protein